MATSKKQRYGILTILIVTVIGTVGSFAVMILSSQTDAKDQVKYQTALDEYTVIQKAYQAKVQAQADELSAQYYPTFSPYATQVAEYSIDSVDSLATEDLLVGDGEEITGSTKFVAYYIGWDATGRIFDQSIDTAASKLKSPLSIETGLDSASLIEGWKVGMKGMHIGGVRLISIPSDQAYGVNGSTDQSGQQTIAPNMPLKFIVMAIPLPTPIEVPDVSGPLQRMQEAQQ